MFKLDQFLRVNREVELPDGHIVTMRVLSDLEMNARRDYAIMESVHISEALKNPESDAYKTKVLPFRDSTPESIVNLLSEGRVIELRREAELQFPVDFVPSPDDPTLADDIDVETRQQQHEASVYKDRLEYIMKGLMAFREKMLSLPNDKLLGEIHARALQVYPQVASKDAEFYYTIWCSIEKDGKRYWNSVDQVRQLPATILNKLDAYYKELDSIDPWELSKSVSTGAADGVGQDDSVR